MTNSQDGDKVFSGSIPELYERYLVPLIFQSYAEDLAGRLADVTPSSVLEIAAGTGVVTRAMDAHLPSGVTITATDLNQPMVDHAASIGTNRAVIWRQADAMDLPFEDGSFDAVVCQFGAMFFPDRGTAYTEMHRVLRPGGWAMFNVWDRIEDNDFADTVTQSLSTLFPDDPPLFLARTPYGYHDVDRIHADVVGAGFDPASTVQSVSARSRAASCTHPAIGFCEGSPLRNEIEARKPGGLAEATAVAAAAIGERFGQTEIEGGIQALVVVARRD